MTSTVFYSSTLAKDDWPSICSAVADDGKVVVVKDRRGAPFMVVTSRLEGIGQPAPLLILPSEAKMNFSAFASLVKTGMTFSMLVNGRYIYCRRHSRYVHPLQAHVDSWIRSLRQQANSVTADDPVE